jgi:PPOX class probable F420-dependent enzyme
MLAELRRAGHGVLVTQRADGRPRPVPFTFAVVDDRLASAVDHKPKSTPRLARLTDIERTGRATALVEHYEDDWAALWWIRVTGRARVHAPDDPFVGQAIAALVAKYPAYAGQRPGGPVYSIELDDVVSWRASPIATAGQEIVDSN